jgi:hypothetical protein
VRGTLQWPSTLDGQRVRADTLDRRAERDQEPGKILNVRL